MVPERVFNLLADPTRLRALLLIHAENEVCVCELTHALQASQPKISRHLALMRDAGLVAPRREGTWMHYSLAGDLPDWVGALLGTTSEHLRDSDPFAADRARLAAMNDRPGKACA